MVGNNAVMRVARTIRIRARGIRTGLNQAAHEISVVVVVLALQKRTNTLKAHAGVDRLHIQRNHAAVSELFVLHEHKVPNLNKTIAVFLR